MKATEPIRNKRNIRKLMTYYLNLGQVRNHVLIVLGLRTALRVSDILRLRWDDVYNFEHRCVKKNITITEQKTGKAKTIALHPDIIEALNLYVDTAKTNTFLIENIHSGKAISRIQAYRIIHAAGEAVEIETRISCYSLRKTFGYHAWKGGTSPAVIMEIYNHSSLAVTRLYLGVTQDDKNEVYLNLKLTA
jgi:integrase